MDIQAIVDVVLGIIIALFGWLGKEIWDACKELRADLAKLRADLPKEYVSVANHKDEMHELKQTVSEDFKEIKMMIQKIFDKLDSKVDRDYR